MNVEIAQRLAELRRQKGYSQEALAQELGLSRQAVSKWERAESAPDTENLIALAHLYGVSLDELLCVDAELEDDMAFERVDKAQVNAAEVKQDAAAREAVANATEAAVRASKAAAHAAEAAAKASGHAASARADAASPKGEKGPFRSFPYAVCCTLLFFILVFLGRAGTGWLVFLTIPIYHYIARVLDGEWSRGGKEGE